MSLVLALVGFVGVLPVRTGGQADQWHPCIRRMMVDQAVRTWRRTLDPITGWPLLRRPFESRRHHSFRL
jgi:hypothetical protein